MFLLAGQSNMSGRGEIVGDSVYDSRILKIAGGTWSVARHPLHADKPEKTGVGPGMSFARSIVDFVPAPVGLVPCAFGGSEIQRWIADGDLLQAAKEAVAKGQAAGGVLKGILWHQGESDCGSEEMASLYIDRLQQLSEDFHSAFGHVPLILGELGMEFLDLEDPRFSFAETVNASIVKFGSSREHIGVVSARGLQHKGDRLHFSSTAADELEALCLEMARNDRGIEPFAANDCGEQPITSFHFDITWQPSSKGGAQRCFCSRLGWCKVAISR